MYAVTNINTYTFVTCPQEMLCNLDLTAFPGKRLEDILSPQPFY